MVQLSKLVPGPTDRAFIVGMTGSGKTVLARYLLASRSYVVVCDPKRRIEWPEYKIHQSLKTLTDDNARYLVYRPSHDAILGWQTGKDPDEMESFFQWVYLRGHTTLYVDEAYLVTRGEELPKFYHASITQGRELGVETWTSTQRPMNVPQIVMSESEHTYAFKLRMEQDRRKVERVCGVPSELSSRLPKHYFYYLPDDGEAKGPLKLDLQSA